MSFTPPIIPFNNIPFQTFFKKSFTFQAERYEEWMAGRCISQGECNCLVIADATDNDISFVIKEKGNLKIEESCEFPFFSSSILQDRIQYATSTEFSNPNLPVVCHLFFKDMHMSCVRFAMTAPDRLIEFYGKIVIRQNDNLKEELKPFVFKSTCHQRFENGTPITDLAECLRTIVVEKNIDGCSGYLIENGDGFIVRLLNDETGKPQMSAKPMRIVEKDEQRVLLRGYLLQAMGPFGWLDFDLSDYGLEVLYKGEAVEKCILHMYDRDTTIEYYTSKKIVKDVCEIEKLVDEATIQLDNDNDGDPVFMPLLHTWRIYRQTPSELKKIQSFEKFGSSQLVLLSYKRIDDIDYREQIASISYLFLSKAIRMNPSDMKAYRNRLLLVITDREALQYTVSSVVDAGRSFFDMGLNPFNARDALYKMEYADLLTHSSDFFVKELAERRKDLEQKISEGFFGKNFSKEDIVNEGRELHEKVFRFLEDKVFVNEDLDF